MGKFKEIDILLQEAQQTETALRKQLDVLRAQRDDSDRKVTELKKKLKKCLQKDMTLSKLDDELSEFP